MRSRVLIEIGLKFAHDPYKFQDLLDNFEKESSYDSMLYRIFTPVKKLEKEFRKQIGLD